MVSHQSQPRIEHRLVDDQTSLQAFVNELQQPHATSSEPNLFVTLGGIQLGPNGSISVLTVYIPVIRQIFVVDLHTLHNDAFTTPNEYGLSLAILLSSPVVPKVVYNSRDVARALFSVYSISLAGAQDLQLMELVTRDGPPIARLYMADLPNCVEHYTALPDHAKNRWKEVYARVMALCNPNQGGSPEVFHVRPLDPNGDIYTFCLNNTALLPTLYGVFRSNLLQLSPRWQLRVEYETEQRLRLGQIAEEDDPVDADLNAMAPWDVDELCRDTPW